VVIGKIKSPIKDQPLRNPGESLDEQIQKFIVDEVLKYYLISGFLILMAINDQEINLVSFHLSRYIRSYVK
jgi:hypothetical protein